MKKSYGNGSIKQRSAGSYQLRWYIAEQGKYQTKTVKGSEAQAKRELRQILAQLDNGTYIAPIKLTVKDVFEQYTELHVKHLADTTTHRSIEIINGSIIPQLGNIKIENLTPLDIDGFYQYLKTSGKKNGGGLDGTTIHNYHRLLNQGMNWAVKKRIIQQNVCQFATTPKLPHKEMKILSEQQLQKLIAASYSNLWGMPILLSASTGARQGECLGLTWDNVDFENQQIYITQTLTYIDGKFKIKEMPKTESSRRWIPIRDTLIKALKAQKEIQQLRKLEWGTAYNELNLVCCREDGYYMQSSNVTRGFQMLLDTLKIPIVRFHDLRHTHASILLQYTSVVDVSKRLGHKNAKITLEIYSHVMPGNGDKVADKFEAVINTAPIHTN